MTRGLKAQVIYVSIAVIGTLSAHVLVLGFRGAFLWFGGFGTGMALASVSNSVIVERSRRVVGLTPEESDMIRRYQNTTLKQRPQ